MTSGSIDTQQASKPVPAALAVAGLVVVGVLLRFVTLAWQDPWLDEITNWQIAEEYGLRLRFSGQPLTYWSQSLGLMIAGDGLFGLRLYSAIFGSLTVMLTALWSWRFLEPWPGALAVLLLSINPMAIFYSQDANHYAPAILAGFMAMAALSVLWKKEGVRWLALVAVLLMFAVIQSYHHVILLAAGGLILHFVVMSLIDSDALPLKTMAARDKRKWLLVLYVVAAVAATPILLNKVMGQWTAVTHDGRSFGLSWDFVSTMLASFYGAIYQYSWLDRVLGVSGAVLSFAGWLWLCRRQPVVGLGAILVVVACMAPFFVITIRQFFSPRYLSPILPAALLGIPVLVSLSLQNRTALTKAALVLCLMWSAVYTGRSVWWYGVRYEGHFQPSITALQWIAENTPDDSIVVVRHNYSATASHFLWQREDMGGRRLRAVEHGVRSAPPAIQQMEELAWDHDHVYFMTLIEQQELESGELRRWLAEAGELNHREPTNVSDAFVPIDWGVPITKLKRPETNPFSLPREAIEASYFVPSVNFRPRQGVEAPASNHRTSIRIYQGGVAVYTLEPQGSNFLTIHGSFESESQHVTVVVEGESYLYRRSDNRDFSFSIPSPEAKRVRLEIANPVDGSDASNAILLHRIDTEESILVEPLTLVQERDAISTMRIDPPILLGEQYKLWENQLAKNSNELTVVSLGTFSHGMGDAYVMGSAAIEDQRLRLFPSYDWQYGPAHRTMVLAPSDNRETMDLSVWAFPGGYGFRPRHHLVEIGPLRVYQLTKEKP